VCPRRRYSFPPPRRHLKLRPSSGNIGKSTGQMETLSVRDHSRLCFLLWHFNSLPIGDGADAKGARSGKVGFVLAWSALRNADATMGQHTPINNALSPDSTSWMKTPPCSLGNFGLLDALRDRLHHHQFEHTVSGITRCRFSAPNADAAVGHVGESTVAGRVRCVGWDGRPKTSDRIAGGRCRRLVKVRFGPMIKVP